MQNVVLLAPLIKPFSYLGFISHLLQMAWYTMGNVRIASLPPWTRSKAMGKALLGYLIYDAFVGSDHKLACIWTSVCDIGFKTILLLLLYLNLGCNDYFHTPMFVEVFVNLCNMWLVCWIMYNLGCMLDYSRSFMILDRLSGLYGLKYGRAIASVVAIVLVFL